MYSLNRFIRRMTLALPIFLASFASPVGAALNAYAELTLGDGPLNGETSMSTIGGVDVSQNHIEIYEFSQTQMVSDKGNDRVVVGPLILLKRQDRTSPLLIQGLFGNEMISGTVKFFGSDPDTGETRLENTIEILGGRITSVEQRLPDAFDPSQASRPTTDIITIEADSLIWTNVLSGNSTAWPGA